MGSRKFTLFPKLPAELRLRIWALTVHARLIRAKWDNLRSAGSTSNYPAIYRLSAGPCPALLVTCSESRFEALKHYSLIRSRLTFNSVTRPGEKTPPKAYLEKMGIKGKGKGGKKEPRIWVCFEIDTLYFVNLPTTPELLSWCRRISNPKIGGLDASNPIKHIALAAHFVTRMVAFHRMDAFYLLCMQHPTLESITIMLDNSKFGAEWRTGCYELYSMKEVAPLSVKKSRGGGQWGCWKVRKGLEDAFEGLWEGKRGVKEVVRWWKWRGDNVGHEPPMIRYMSLSKGKEVVKAVEDEGAEGRKIVVID